MNQSSIISNYDETTSFLVEQLPAEEEIIFNFIPVVKSIGTLLLMAFIGGYAEKSKFATAEGRRFLAHVSQKITIPCLLWSTIVLSTSKSQLIDASFWNEISDVVNPSWWIPLLILILWPFYNIACGFIVGHFSSALSKTPSSIQPIIVGSCALSNSSGILIAVLSTMATNLTTSSEFTSMDPIFFLAIYLLIYPILQLMVGRWLIPIMPSKHVVDTVDAEQGEGTETYIFSNDTSNHDGALFQDHEHEGVYHAETTSLLSAPSSPLQRGENRFSNQKTLKKGSPQDISSEGALSRDLVSLITTVIATLLGLIISFTSQCRSLFIHDNDEDLSRSSGAQNSAIFSWVLNCFYSVSIIIHSNIIAM